MAQRLLATSAALVALSTILAIPALAATSSSSNMGTVTSDLGATVENSATDASSTAAMQGSTNDSMQATTSAQ